MILHLGARCEVSEWLFYPRPTDLNERWRIWLARMNPNRFTLDDQVALASGELTDDLCCVVAYPPTAHRPDRRPDALR